MGVDVKKRYNYAPGKGFRRYLCRNASAREGHFSRNAGMAGNVLRACAICLMLNVLPLSLSMPDLQAALILYNQAENKCGPLKNLRCGPFRLDIGGNFRLRYEYQKGFDVRAFRPEAEDGLLLTRIMLDFNLRFGEEAGAQLQLRDARAIDSELGRDDFSTNNPIEDWCDIRQAFVQWSHIAGSPIGIKAGRQQISYGDQRVFGPGLWGNTGRFTWDAVMITANPACIGLDLWVGRYIENRPERWPNRAFANPTALVVYASIKNLPVILDIFHAYKYDGRGNIIGEKGEGNLQSFSSGIQTRGMISGKIDYTATAVYQCGKYGGDDISACGTNLGIGITAFMPWKIRLAAQLTRGSGDRDPYDGRHQTFDGVFGGADLNFYGDLNLFYWANLRDYELDLHITPYARFRVMVEYHYFTLDQARDAWYTTGLKQLHRDISGSLGTALGHELNFRVVSAPTEALEITCGFGQLFPGAYIRNFGDGLCIRGLFIQSTCLF